MDTIEAFFRFSLLAIFLITLAWPLNIPLMALAYKVRHGAEPIPLPANAFWMRSSGASFGLAALSGVFFGLLLLLVWLLDPKEMGTLFALVPIGLFIAYLPLAAWFLLWVFALEELYEGLGVFGIYILIPALPMLLIAWLIGFQRIGSFVTRMLGL